MITDSDFVVSVPLNILETGRYKLPEGFNEISLCVPNKQTNKTLR